MSINFLKTVFLFLCMATLMSCEEKTQEVNDNYTLTVKTNLDTTVDGFYRLKLDLTRLPHIQPTTIQTLHVIEGNLLSDNNVPGQSKLIKWESSHMWVSTDSLDMIIYKTINRLGYWVPYDTIYIDSFKGTIIPIVSNVSYTDMEGEFINVIAPVDEMIGDTLTIKAKFMNLEKTINIILE